MEVSIPFGRGAISASLPDDATVVLPNEAPVISDLGAALQESMSNPIGTKPLEELARGKRSATIVVNDVTRPTPTRAMAEAVVDKLCQAGMQPSRIRFVVANGTHRACTIEEIEGMIGKELLEKHPVHNHCCYEERDMVFLGRTGRGVPVSINRHVWETDLRILTGTIAPHQTAGFSGGRKSLAVGVAGFDTIKATHSPPIRPLDPVMGQIQANSFNAELFAISRKVGVDFIVNVVEGPRHQVSGVVCGDVESAWLEGEKLASAIWRRPVARKADVAITSPGGYPRDIDLYQAQKAIAAAEMVVRPGGAIVLVAECADGTGTGKFARLLRNAPCPERIVRDFIANGYEAEESSKAFLFARALSKHSIFVVTDGVPAEELEGMFMKKANTVEEALREALAAVGTSHPNIVCLPYAAEVIPVNTQKAD